jgi:V/A-type H+-transporting ATPase subunit I
MERVLMAGPQSLLEPCLESLHKARVIHVTSPTAAKFLGELGFEPGVSAGLRMAAAEKLLFDVKSALQTLVQILPDRKDILSFGPTTELDWLEQARVENISAICDRIARTHSKMSALSAERDGLAAHKRFFGEFKPLVGFFSELKSVEIAGVVLRERNGTSEHELESALYAAVGGAYEIFRGAAREGSLALLVAYPKRERKKMEREVFDPLAGKISRVRAAGGAQNETEGESISSVFEKDEILEKKLAACGKILEDYAVRYTALLRSAERGLEYTVKQLLLRDFIASSPMVFCVSGWIPADKRDGLGQMLAGEFGGKIIMATSKPTPTEYQDTPVLLRNPSWASPFERLLGFFPPPIYGSVDPVLSVMFFFPLFFGLIVGDIGYGLILFLVARFIGLRRGGSAVWEDVSKILYACVFSTMLFGAVYGEFFGFSSDIFGLPSPLFDRKRETGVLLSAVLALGVIHLSLGNLMGALDWLRRGYFRRGAVNLLDLSLIWFAGWIGYQWFATGGPGKLSVYCFVFALMAKTVLDGPKAMMEIVRVFSGVLSYARLMALGLASVMLAAAANKMFEVAGSGVFGFLGALGLHTLNFVLGLFSPVIQSLRLHVVEFFSQFARQGNVRFAPFGAE